jgi:hypothetical protein
MKTLTTILFCLLLLTSCTFPEKESYNVQKDAWLNDVMNTPLLKIEQKSSESFDYVKMYYEECMLTYWHSKYIPYKQIDEWRCACVRKDGTEEFLYSFMDIKEHKVSSATLQRIKDKAEQILNKP